MKRLSTVSVRFWLPVLVVAVFTLLLSMSSLWRAKQALKQIERNAVSQVKTLMTVEKSRLEMLMSLNGPGAAFEAGALGTAMPEVDFFAFIDDESYVLHSNQHHLIGQIFNTRKTGFDQNTIRHMINNNMDVELGQSRDFILAYQPILMQRSVDINRKNPVGILLLNYNLSRLKVKIKQNYVNDFLIHLSFAFVVSLGVMLFLRFWYVRPLVALQEVMNRIGQGDFSTDIKLTGGGELAVLGRGISQIQQSRQSTDRTLRDTEQYFQNTFRLMPAALALHCEAGIFIDCSDAFCEATGYSREETVGRSALDMQLWAKPEQRVAMRAKLERDGQVEGIEYQLRHRSGRITIMQMSARYLMIGGARVLLSVAHDITERKQAEAALHDSEKRFQDTFRFMPAALALNAEQGVFLDCSDAFCQATGYSREEIVGHNGLELNLWALPEQRKIMRDNLLRDGLVENFEYQLLHRSGKTTMMQMSACNLLIGGERLLLSFAHDISARKKADADLLVALNEKTALLKEVQESENVLREAKLSAEIANKSKSAFLASMSHEIRTPINGVLGLTQLLSETPLNKQQKEFVNTILTSGNALMTILNDILDLSKMEAGKMEIEFVSYQPRQLVNDVVDAMSVLASQKKIQLTLSCSEDVPRVASSDPTRIRQILFNLIGNAVKFTQEGCVNVVLSIQQSNLRFEIKDSGVGIAPDKQPLLFQMFTQENASTSRTFGGSGLGLAITKQLVTLMGGKLGFESEKNIGSTFWVELPLGVVDENTVLEGDAVQAFHKRKITADDFSNSCVLLVDDNDVNLMVAGGMLKNLGVPFDVALSGKEAIDKIFKKGYDLVLMDCEMPEQDGYDTTREIRQRERNLEIRKGVRGTPVLIVALTANAMSEDKKRCLDSGMDGFLAKPLKMDELYGTLVEYIICRVLTGHEGKVSASEMHRPAQ